MKLTKLFSALAMVLGASFVTAPAHAALILGSTSCSVTDVSPGASKCVGWYSGNLNGGSAAKKADSASALNALLGTSLTGSSLSWLEDLSPLSGSTVNFGTPLFGNTVVSFHVGAANGQSTGVGYQGTAFYLFDAGNLIGGLDTLTFNRAGLSNARLYSTSQYVPPSNIQAPVPEPATWMTMILGFGLIGGAMRVRRRPKQRVQFAL